MSNGTPQSVITIKAVDHIVLYARSVEESVKWYTEVLGMKHEVFKSSSDPNDERHALKFGTQKINLHQANSPFSPHANNPEPGSADLCFITEVPIEQVHQILNDKKLHILEDNRIVERTGAVGKLKSVYVRDPDGNLIEIPNY